MKGKSDNKRAKWKYKGKNKGTKGVLGANTSILWERGKLRGRGRVWFLDQNRDV
jgi:hypothetical protein